MTLLAQLIVLSSLWNSPQLESQFCYPHSAIYLYEDDSYTTIHADNTMGCITYWDNGAITGIVYYDVPTTGSDSVMVGIDYWTYGTHIPYVTVYKYLPISN